MDEMRSTVRRYEGTSGSGAAAVWILACLFLPSSDSWGARQGSLPSERDAVRRAYLVELNDVRELAEYPSLRLSNRLNRFWPVGQILAGP